MASIYDIKPRFQNLLRPFSNWLAYKHVTANEITLAALVLSATMGIVLFIFPNKCWLFLWVPCVLAVRMVLNAIDGMLAREFHMQSAFGTYLNELGDVISDAFLYLPFCFVTGLSSSLVVVIVLLAILSEMTGIIATQIGVQRRYDGPMGKSDRAFVFGTIGLLIGLRFPFHLFINILFVVLIMLLLLTIFNRIKSGLLELKL